MQQIIPPTIDLTQNPNTQVQTSETASVAMAAKQQALVQARCVMARANRRDYFQVRQSIISACKRPGFAEAARYEIPFGGETVQGYTIRFAEECMRSMTNMASDVITVADNEFRKTVSVSVTDLESNSTYGDEAVIEKTVERKYLKDGEPPISSRTNSKGEIVYLVMANEEQVQMKTAARVSRIIRTGILRLVPGDILEEALQEINKTYESGGADVNEAAKKILDGFSSIGVMPADIIKFLGHSVGSISPKELKQLRLMYAAIRDGDAAWVDYLPEKQSRKKPDFGAGDKKPGDPAKEGEAPKADEKKTETPPPAAQTPPETTQKEAGGPQPEKKPDLKVLPPPETPKNPEKPGGPATATKAAPAPVTKEPAPATPTGSAKEQLQGKLSAGGVSFPDFAKWCVSTTRHQGSTWNNWEEVPEEFCKTLLMTPRPINNLIMLRGSAVNASVPTQ